jgi:hypothetical protein
MTELDCSVFDACSFVTMGKADLPAMWYFPTSPNPVMEGPVSGINMGDLGILSIKV